MHLVPLLLAAAIGVSAHPSGHLHLHRAVHQKKDAVVISATIDGKVVSWTQGAGSPFVQAQKPTPVAPTTTVAPTTPAAAPAPAATTTSAAPAAQTSSSSSSSGGGQGVSTYTPFGCSKKRATDAQINYVGNTGCNGVYGSNIKLVQDSVASQYTYVIKAVSGSQDMQCKVWNKIGPDGGLNGFFNGNEALSFTLPANSAQHIAFDSNSQGGMCCSDNSIPLTAAGEFLCPWVEYDFGDTSNSGWSGFDASALVAGSAGGPFKGLKVCTADNSVCSTLNNGGGGTNAYLPGDEAADGIGGNLPDGPVSLIADYSYSG